MKKGLNLAAAEFDSAVRQAVNSSRLPAFAVRMVLEKVLLEVRDLEAQSIRKEQKEFQDAEEEHRRAGSDKEAEEE